MIAKFPGTCPVCNKAFEAGVTIDRVGDAGWGHYLCVHVKDSRQTGKSKKKRNGSAKAEAAFLANKARIESGETFRSQYPSTFRKKTKRE